MLSVPRCPAISTATPGLISSRGILGSSLSRLVSRIKNLPSMKSKKEPSRRSVRLREGRA
jgi:hypothetical protein